MISLQKAFKKIEFVIFYPYQKKLVNEVILKIFPNDIMEFAPFEVKTYIKYLARFGAYIEISYFVYSIRHN